MAGEGLHTEHRAHTARTAAAAGTSQLDFADGGAVLMEQAGEAAAAALPRQSRLYPHQLQHFGPRHLADAEASAAKDQHRRLRRQVTGR